MSNCQEEGCGNIEIYRLNKPIRCKEHASQSFFFRCEQKSCKEKALYGYEYQKGICCIKHASKDMNYVMYKKCQEDCKERALFGYEFKNPIHCIKHATEDMDYVFYGKCLEKDCIERANFGKRWDEPLYCKQHASTKDMKYVSYQNCRTEDCEERAFYGKVFKRPLYCKKHACEDMELVVYIQCLEEECKNKATYNIKTKKLIYCEKHMKKEEKEHRNFYLNKDEWINSNIQNNLTYYIKNFKEISDSFNLYGSDNILFFSWHSMIRKDEREITKLNLFYEIHNTPNKITDFNIPMNVRVRFLTNSYNIIITRKSKKEYILVTIWKITEEDKQTYSYINLEKNIKNFPKKCDEMVEEIDCVKKSINPYINSNCQTKDFLKQCYKAIDAINHLKKINKKTNKNIKKINRDNKKYYLSE